MATHTYELAEAPDAEDEREAWLQHAAGFILFQDVRQYALDRMDPNLDDATRAAVQKGIDDAVYGLMMVIDGVSGALSNAEQRVEIGVFARHYENDEESEGTLLSELNLAESDGMCGASHGWKEGDFGSTPVVGSGQS